MHTGTTTILVVDDDTLIRELVTLVLRDAGYGVDAVASGEEALARVGDRAPDLLVLDYAMPVVSGRDVLRRLAQLGADFPVLVLSASMHAEQCLAEGAAGLVRKPFIIPDLLQAVEQCLALAPRPARTHTLGAGQPYDSAAG